MATSSSIYKTFLESRKPTVLERVDDNGRRDTVIYDEGIQSRRRVNVSSRNILVPPLNADIRFQNIQPNPFHHPSVVERYTADGNGRH